MPFFIAFSVFAYFISLSKDKYYRVKIDTFQISSFYFYVAGTVMFLAFNYFSNGLINVFLNMKLEI